MSLLTARKSYAPLQEGPHLVTIHSFEEAKSKDEQYEFVKFEIRTVDEDRPITFNKFETGLNIMVAQIRQQLIPDDTQAYDIIEILNMAKQHPVICWIDYHTIDGRTYRNENFAEPQIHSTQETTTTEEEF